MPRRLEPFSAADTAWLRMERPENSMTITSVVTFSTPISIETLKALVEERLLPFRRFRQRVTFLAGRPFWEDDPYFDLDLHIHRRALPEPADETALQEAVGDLMSQRPDFTKPLWHMYLFENYQGGSALVIRIHHCIADGIALVNVFLSMVDEHFHPENLPYPSTREFLSSLLELVGLDVLTPALDLVSQTLTLSEQALELGLEVLQNPSRVEELLQEGSETAHELYRLLTLKEDPPTLFKQGLSGKRRACWTSPIPDAYIRAIKKGVRKELGEAVTTNDIVQAAVTGALRTYLLTHGQTCANLEVRAIVPVNLRPLKEALKLGNYFGLVFLELPLHISDITMRLRETKKRMDALKQSAEAVIAYRILQLLGAAPAELQERALEYFSARASMVISNVPGPRTTVHLGGAPIDTLIFWVPQSGTMNLGISIMSYARTIRVGFTSDARSVPDPEALVAAFQKEFEALYERFGVTYAPQPDSPSTNR